MPTSVPSWDDAWVAALDELELAVGDAERMLSGAHALAVPAPAWQPPVGLGPLPAPLEARARAILERQLAVAERLSVAAIRSRRQLRVHDQLVPSAPHLPVYVDVDG